MPELNNYCVWLTGFERDWKLVSAEGPQAAAEVAGVEDYFGLFADPCGAGLDRRKPVVWVEDEARKAARFRLRLDGEGVVHADPIPEKPAPAPHPTPLIDWLEKRACAGGGGEASS